MSITPEELTGARVRELREHYKLSRSAFYTMCGWPGASTARLMNIEQKDSWKTGDRERVANILNQLSGNTPTPLFDPQIHQYAVNADAPVFCFEGDVEFSLDDNIASIEHTTVCVTPLVDDVIEIDGVERQITNAPAQTLPLPLAAVQEDPCVHPNCVDTDAPDAYLVTNGQLQTFKRCRRKWWLAFYRELGLTARNYTNARATGTRVHRALEAYYRPEGHPRTDPREALEAVLLDDWTALLTEAKAKGHDEFIIGNITEDFKKAALLERAIVEGYVEWLAEIGPDSDLRIIASETVIETDVEVTKRDGTKQTVKLKGLLDVRARRVSDGVILFIDHKTVGTDLKTPVATLHMNEQMLHYHLLEWLSRPENEARCDGALYNMLRKVKRTARATPPFYERVEVRHSEHELASYGHQMNATIVDILDTVDRLDNGVDHHDVVYPTRKEDCKWECDFFAVCPMFDDGSRVEDALAGLYTKIDPHERYEPRGLGGPKV